jgi:hypothetical protein
VVDVGAVVVAVALLLDVEIVGWELVVEVGVIFDVVVEVRALFVFVVYVGALLDVIVDSVFIAVYPF